MKIYEKILKKSIESFERNRDGSNNWEKKFIYVLKNGKVVNEENSDLFINLASTSKPFIILFYSKLLTKKLVPVQLEVTKDLVEEMVRRGKKEVFVGKLFKEINLYIEKKIEDFPIVFIDFNFFAFLALKYSSNIAIQEIIKVIIKSLKEPQEEFNRLEIFEGFKLNLGEFDFLTQSGANTGKVRDAVYSFRKLIKDKNKDYAKFVRYMLNGKSFGLAESLKKEGCKDIICKDGILWPICWGKRLSDQSFPPHLIAGILYSFTFKKDIYTIGSFTAREINLPKNKDLPNFPDNITEKKYNRYIALEKHKIGYNLFLLNKKILKREGIEIKNIKFLKIVVKSLILKLLTLF